MMEIETMKKMVGISDALILKERAYVSNRLYNSFIIYNTQKNVIEYIDSFVHMDDLSFAYHGGCIEHDGILYFYPDNGYGVHSYDTNKGCQKFYDLGFCRVGFSYILEDKLILFPWYSEQGLIVIDLKKDTIQLESDWWNASQILRDEKIHFLNSGMYDNNRVWSHCTKTNCLLISDCYKQVIQKHVIDVGEKKLWGSQYDGNDFWFSVVGENIIYQWNIEVGLKKTYRIDCKDWGKTYEVSPFRKIVCVANGLFIIPYNENALFLLNKKTEKVELISRFPDETIYPQTKYWNIKERIFENQLYLFCDFTNMIVQVDLDRLCVKYINTQLSGDKKWDEYVDQKWKLILEEIHNKDSIYENGYDWKMYLTNYIQIDYKGYRGTTESFHLDNIGKKIYREAIAE
ncbi:hypothetical protein D3Z51_03865 [Clostridiaceae bacterium]|nr:hypothetical protein [Clostridiaceae bacterium]RKI16916.1 hypothetical protein D7V81_04145 [bacterium 1XD21-70]